MNEQIEEMAKHVCQYAYENCEKACPDGEHCTTYSTCNLLYNAGYRKQSGVERLQAEVDRLQKHNTEFARKHYEDGYKTAKTEVAREIFEEIEFDIHQLMFEQDEHRAIAIEGVIAKLKKEYTEGKE